MKKVAKSKPVIAVAKVAMPIEVGLALSIGPIHIARIRVAIKHIRIECHQFHHLSNTLKVVYYL